MAESRSKSLEVSGRRLAKRLLFIGWDGAQASTLKSMLDAGRLPHLGSLVDSGVVLELAVPRPIFPQAAWTSLATGKRPHEHGVLHAFSRVGDGPELRPISRLDRKCNAIWKILSVAGLHTHVIGWPVTHPAESVRGIFISDRFATDRQREFREAFQGSAVMPPAVSQILVERGMAPHQVEDVTLAQLLSSSAIGVREFSRIESACREILAQAATLFRAIRWCLDSQPWDFAACVFPGIRRCHQIADLISSSRLAPESCEHLIAGCYEHHDLLLGQLLSQIDNNTHVLVASPSSGMNLAPGETSESIANSTSKQGFQTGGLAVLSGPNICPPARILPRSLLDIAPTILAMFGVSYGQNMGGKPLQDLFEGGLATELIESWDLRSSCGTVQQSQAVASNAEDASDRFPETQHLSELGYTDPLETLALEGAVQCQRMTDLNRAISMMDAGLFSQTVALLEPLAVEYPNWVHPRSLLAETHYRARRYDAAREQLNWLTCHGFENPHLYLLFAAVEAANRQFDHALNMANCARRGAVMPSEWSFLTGSIYLRQRNFAAAEAAFQQAIESEVVTAPLLDGMASTKLHMHEYEEAAVYALDALERDMRLAKAHYHLAVALYFLGKPEESLQALTTWSALEPRAAAPYRWMACVHRRMLQDSKQAESCLQKGRRVIRLRRDSIATGPAADTSTLFRAQ